MADNKNMEINDEEMQNAAGGNIGLPFPRFKEGDHVIAKNYEQYDAVIAKVIHYSDSMNIWRYEVHIFHPKLGTLIQDMTDRDLSPA